MLISSSGKKNREKQDKIKKKERKENILWEKQ